MVKFLEILYMNTLQTDMSQETTGNIKAPISLSEYA